jgi:two-component system, response regulator PdtaR
MLRENPLLHAPNDEGGSASRRASARILIVEDDYFVGLQMQQELPTSAYKVVGIASDAREATALAKANKPDLVVMDIRLAHGDDGIELANQLLHDFGLRCVFVTAHSDKPTRDRAVSARPLGWLSKPFDSESLIEGVRRALQEKDLGEDQE